VLRARKNLGERGRVAIMWTQFKKALDAIFSSQRERVTSTSHDGSAASPPTNTQYWTKRTVTNHLVFRSREQSLEYLHWRNSQYLFYESLMPLDGHDGEIILDYGCGPGNDMVGFAEFSRPQRIIGMDISLSALSDARRRLALHGDVPVQLMHISEYQSTIPLRGGSVDFIHSSGVLHHLPNLKEVLGEFRRILSPQGKIRLMIYNYDSVWNHLYVSYHRQIKNAIDSEKPLAEAFQRSTDGEGCPFSRSYKRDEFLGLVATCGFRGTYLGSAISLHEMSLLPERYQAMVHLKLAHEHREFLKRITFDKYGRPLHNGEVAGIDSVYELTK